MRSEDETTIATTRPALPAHGDCRPCLLVTGGKSLGKHFWINRHRIVVGRSESADIRLFDDGVSRNHARIVTLPNRVLLLKDVDSTNGTFVDGRRVRAHVLQPGDSIRVGSKAMLRFEVEDEVQAALHERLHAAAHRDPLTQLPNKRFFTEQLELVAAACKRSRSALALVLMDIDHFKAINDDHGHLAGDEVLKSVARTLSDALGSNDHCARIGGEEFAILLPGRDELGAISTAEHLRQLVAETPRTVGTARIPVTASFGVAVTDGRFDPSRLVAEADARLYGAKSNGRNCVIPAPPPGPTFAVRAE